MVFKMARKTVMAQTKGMYPAPLKIIDVVQAGTAAAESQGFGELLVSPESKGLRHLFHCITALKKDNGPGTEGVEPLPVSHVGMLGAGLMGTGIATVLADKGVRVRLKDQDLGAVLGALSHARKYFGKAVKRRRYKSCGARERLERLGGGTDYAGFGQADIVIEAIPEILDLKRQVVAEIEAHSDRPRPHPPIFASNTSSLPIGDIAEGCRYPERVIGMHFFSPVEKMPLVEIIVTDQTDPVVTATTVALSRKMGKHVIVVRDCPGFYTTRALAPYMIESMFLALEGYALPDIDAAAISVGFPIGPITLMDEVGIDVGAKVIKTMKQSYAERMEFPESDLIDAFMAEGRLGKKANKGFYVYENGESKTTKGTKIVDPEVAARMSDQSPSRDLPAMAERLLLALVNEAAWCLHEGILREPRAGDLGAVMGIGFPPFEGGPFRYCDRVGIQHVVTRLRALEGTHGRRFRPCPALVERADSGEAFYPSP
jgi:3-hydroxyacyl-CoA dehydrogenase/enoyl-CoA hydratase/3-hydroxybutyryl-CoA epimerase